MDAIHDEINQLLAGLRPAPLPELRVDTMRHSFAVLPASVEWPAVTVTGITPPEQAEVARLVAEHLPGFVSRCNLLPEPRPRRDSHQVQFVRGLRVGDRDLLYMLRISAEYMGGAEGEEILEPARQGRSPRFRTDRIYYAGRLLPVRSIERSGDAIVDFEAYSIRDADFLVRQGGEGELLEMFATALFDEIDFSSLEQRFQDMLSFGADWKAGRIFRPFVVDYLTLCLNLPVPTAARIDAFAPVFARTFDLLTAARRVANLASADQEFWRGYYSAWAFRNDFSRAGNPQWVLTEYPDER